MKKKIAKIVTVTLVLLFTFATGVSADALYHKWLGTEEYEQTKLNLTSFESSYDSLFATKQQLVQENIALTDELEEAETALTTANKEIEDADQLYEGVKNQLTNLITDVNESNGKGNRYDTLVVKVNELAGYVGVEGEIDDNVGGGGGSKSEELKQAEKDMTDLQTKSNALLEKIQEQQ